MVRGSKVLAQLLTVDLGGRMEVRSEMDWMVMCVVVSATTLSKYLYAAARINSDEELAAQS